MAKILYVFVLMVWLKINLSAGKGYLEIKLERYENPSKSLANRMCCDIATSVCRIDCSNSFQLCVSTVSSNGVCDVVKLDDIGKSKISDDELFSTNDDRFQNPIKVTLPDGFAKDAVYLSINVFHKTVSLVASFASGAVKIDGSQSTWIDIGRLASPERRTYQKFLTLSARTTCDVGYEGKLCDRKTCVPRDDNQGHYTCTKDNQIICLPGWMDPNTGCIKKIIISSSTILLSPSSTVIESTALPTSTTLLTKHHSLLMRMSSEREAAMTSLSLSTSSKFIKTVISDAEKNSRMSQTPWLKVVSSSLLKETFSSMLPTFSSSSVIDQRVTMTTSSTKSTTTTNGTENKRQFCVGKGNLEIKLERYENPSKSLANQKCCDVATSVCRIDCSNSFQICVSTVSPTSVCDIVNITDIGESEIGDDEFFSNVDDRLKNPIKVYLPDGFAKDVVYLSIKVYHKGTSLVATFESSSVKIYKSQSSWLRIGPLQSTDQRSHQKYLTLIVRTFCETPSNISKKSDSNTFPIILSMVVTVALICWLIVLLLIRKRLLAKAKIRVIMQNTGSLDAQTPQECHESFTSMAPLTNNNNVTTEPGVFFKETALRKSVPDH